MRRLFIVLGIVALLLVAAVVLAAFNLNAFLDANRDRVASQVRDAIGRDVAFGEIGVSLAGGFGVRVADLRVGDDPAFSQEDFLTTDAVDVRIALLPALFGRIEISRVVLRGPSITVIQTARGLSTDSLGGGAEGAEAAEPGGSPPALLVALVDVRGATLRFVDRTAKPPGELRVEQLDFQASDISFSEPVTFELRAALLGSKEQNLRAAGAVGPLEAESPRADLELRVDPLVFDSALAIPALASALPPELAASGPARVDVEVDGTLTKLRFDARFDARGAAVRYGEAFEKPAGVPLSLSVRGERTGSDAAVEALDLVLAETKVRGKATVKNLDDPKIAFSLASDAVAPAAFGAGSPGDAVRDLDVQGNVSFPASGMNLRAAARSPSGTLSGAPYRDLAVDVRMAGERVDLEKLSLAAFDGDLTAKGVYETGDPKKPRFDFDARLSDMRVEKILENQLPAAARFATGKLGMDLDLRGAGSGWDAIKPTLTGSGALRVVEGVIRDFNPVGPTFRAILQLPTFTSTRLRALLDEHPQVFGVGDTPFQMLDGKLQIRDGWVDARDFALTASDYVLSGKGRYSLDNALDFGTVLAFSKTLSDELVAAQSSFRYLRNADGRVSLPVDVRGAPPKLSVYPDVAAVAKAASGELLTGVLEKALRGKGSPLPSVPAPEGAGAPPGASEPAAPPPRPEDVTGELLRRGLGELLRDRSAPKQ